MSQWQSCEQSFGAFAPGAAKILPPPPTSFPLFLNRNFSDIDFFSYILYGKCCTCSEAEVNVRVNVLLFYVLEKCEGLCGGTSI